MPPELLLLDISFEQVHIEMVSNRKRNYFITFLYLLAEENREILTGVLVMYLNTSVLFEF